MFLEGSDMKTISFLAFMKAVNIVKMAAVQGSILSPDIWKNWEKHGKSEFIKLLKNSLTDTSSNQQNQKAARCIYELLSKGVNGSLKKELVVAVLEEIVLLHMDVPSIILDVFNILDNETICSEINEERNNFCTIVRESEKVIPEKLLKERLEIDTLQDVGTLKNRNFYTKFIRIKTKLYYKQKKFNLFREESEGYAKLITQLNQEISQNFTAENLLQATKSLIGCFNLDPNRVLDIILEAFELRTDKADVFTELLKCYSDEPNVVCEILGFKFSHYYKNKEQTPASLYTVTALMLQYGIIELDEIYPWLMPLDSVIEKDWENEMKEAKEYVRKLNIISTKEKENEENEPEKESIQEKYAMNQKFGLCEALLSIGAWSVCQELCKNLPDRCVTEQPPVAKAMCTLLNSLIEPLYAVYCPISDKVKRKPASPLTYKYTPAAVSSFLALRNDVIPMLLTLGPSLHFDPVLMYKIIRLCKVSLQQLTTEGERYYKPTEEDSLYYDIIVLLDTVILPALSYMDCNCSVAEEVWDVLKNFPYQIRYCLYSRWKNETPNQYAKLLKKNGEALKNIKNIMKRVSKETIKPVGRLIGKLTHASPGVLFDYILIQIQMYDNLIIPVVDSLKFLTNLSYDVLGYCLVETLANTSLDKDRFQHDGMSISNWLHSLSSFCGSAFKKYNIELAGLLQYVANQLKGEKSLELLILREVVQKMAGIEAAEEITPDQLSAMSGGEMLKGEAGYFSQVRNTKKSSLRLKEALSEQDLGVSLCLLMAQQRYCVVYRETDKSPLKLVGKLYDQCQDTLVQFGTFLCSTLSVDEYDARFPSIHAMLSEYHISADVAFFLARPTLNHAINMKYDALRKADPNYKNLSVAAKQQTYCDAVAEVMTPIVESVKPLHSIKVWEDISPQFLVTFWSLTMYDLQVPVEIYQKEINKIKQSSLQALDSKDLTASKGKKEQERCNALMEKLQDERKKQAEHVEKVMVRLKLEKDTWFPTKSLRSPKNESIMQFLQLCVFPRCIFTSIDALYCSKFIHTIHTLKTANFSTLLCFDKLLCDLTYTVTLCTQNEANRYGLFLCSVLELVMRWHGSESIFKAECSNHPGFVTKFRVSNQFSDANDEVSYENYRHVCHKWHYKITKAMVVCLESKDYVQIRNALLVLIKILPHFPVIIKLAQIIEKTIDKVQKEEKNQRQDLHILATSYGGYLKAKTPQMVRESDFHQVQAGSKQASKSGKEKKEVNAESGDKLDKKEKSAGKSSENKENGKSRSSRKEIVIDNKRETTPTVNSKEIIKIEKEEVREESRIIKEEKQRSKERKEDKHLTKDDRAYRDERYIESIPLSKDEQRYSGGYYSGGGHFVDETRDLSSLSNSSSGSHKHGGEILEPDRDVKRRKLDGSSTSKSKKNMQWVDPSEKTEKKERSSRAKEKIPRDKDKDKDKKERKLGRKRDRLADDGTSAENNTKLRKDDEKGSFKSSSHQNGSSDMMEPSHREKRHYPRQISPSYQTEREPDKSRERVVRSSHSTDRARSIEVSDREPRDREPRDRESRDNYRRPDTSKRR